MWLSALDTSATPRLRTVGFQTEHRSVLPSTTAASVLRRASARLADRARSPVRLDNVATSAGVPRTSGSEPWCRASVSRERRPGCHTRRALACRHACCAAASGVGWCQAGSVCAHAGTVQPRQATTALAGPGRSQRGQWPGTQAPSQCRAASGAWRGVGWRGHLPPACDGRQCHRGRHHAHVRHHAALTVIHGACHCCTRCAWRHPER